MAVPGASAHKAHCIDDVILTYVQTDRGSHICVLRVDQMAVSLGSTWEVHDELNCLSLLPHPNGCHIISGSLSAAGHPTISILSLDGILVAREELRKDDGKFNRACIPYLLCLY